MTLPVLEERFQAPPGWRWHSFKHNGRTLRFGTASPINSIPDAVVVCLERLSEFGDKYFEVARDCLAKNMAFWVLDWAGQGLSSRYLKNPQKRHSQGFDRDVDDLHAFIMGYIKHSSVHPDKGRIPLVMLAHSTGGNIGLRYLAKHPGMFECAAFTAPLLGLKAIQTTPSPVINALSGILNLVCGTAYLPGQTKWQASTRDTSQPELFSSDPVRRKVHNAWFLTNPALQVGGITCGWIYQALKSCAVINNAGFLESTHTHCLLALAGQEGFVDNDHIKSAARRLPNAQLIELPSAHHEILMEADPARSAFLQAFYKLIDEHIIQKPETLKPF